MSSISSNESKVRPHSCRLLFVVGDHLGHLYAVQGVARRLQKRGHHVHFITGGRPEPIQAAGFDVQRMDWLACEPDFSELTRRERRARLREAVEQADDGARALVETLRPDLVLYQPFQLIFHPILFAHGASRAVAFSTKPLLTRDRLVPPYTSSLVPVDDLLGRARISSTWWRARLSYARYRWDCALRQLIHGHSHRTFAMALAERSEAYPWRRHWRTRPLAFDMRWADVPELVLHAREFDLPRSRPLRHEAYFVGPCVDEARARAAWIPPPGWGPLVYCSFGTEPAQQSAVKIRLYERLVACAEALQGHRWVIATADESLTQRLRARRSTDDARIAIETWVPQLAAISSAAVVVTHGGANTTKEALSRGKPLVVLPMAADQPGIAARVVLHGLGVACPARDATASDIGAAVQRVVGDARYQLAASHMQRIFATYDAKATLELTVESLASGWLAACESADQLV